MNRIYLQISPETNLPLSLSIQATSLQASKTTSVFNTSELVWTNQKFVFLDLDDAGFTDFYTISVNQTVAGFVQFSVLQGMVCYETSHTQRTDEICENHYLRVKRVCGERMCEREYVEVMERGTENVIRSVKEGVIMMCVEDSMVELEASCDRCDRWAEGSSVEIEIMLEGEWIVLCTYHYDERLQTPSFLSIPIPLQITSIEESPFLTYVFSDSAIVDVLIWTHGSGSFSLNEVEIAHWTEETQSWHRFLIPVSPSDVMKVVDETDSHCKLRIVSSCLASMLLESWSWIDEYSFPNHDSFTNSHSLTDHDSFTHYTSHTPIHSFLFSFPSHLHLVVNTLCLTLSSFRSTPCNLLLEGFIDGSWLSLLNTTLSWSVNQLVKVLSLPTVSVTNKYRITLHSDIQWSLAELYLSISPIHPTESLYNSSLLAYQGYSIAFQSSCTDCFSFSVIPSLPRPLILDTSTGLIYSDDPLMIKGITEHTITALSRSQGSLVAVTTIEVKECLRPDWLVRLCLTVHRTCDDVNVTLTDGQKVFRYSVRNPFQETCYHLCLPEATYTLTSSVASSQLLRLSLISVPSSITLFSVSLDSFSTHTFSLHDVFRNWIYIADPIIPWNIVSNESQWKKSSFPVAENPSEIGILIRTQIKLTNPQSILRIFIQFMGGFMLYINGQLTALMNLPSPTVQESLTLHEYTQGESVSIPVSGKEIMQVHVICTRYQGQSESEFVRCDMRGIEIEEEMDSCMLNVLSSPSTLPSVHFTLLNQVSMVLTGYTFTLSRIPAYATWILEGMLDEDQWSLLHLQPPTHLYHRSIRVSDIPALMAGYRSFRLTFIDDKPFHSIQFLTMKLLTPSFSPPLCIDLSGQYLSVPHQAISTCLCPTGFSGYLQRRCEVDGFGPVDSSRCRQLSPQHLHYLRSVYQFPCGIMTQTDIPKVTNRVLEFDIIPDLPDGLALTETGQIIGKAECEEDTELDFYVTARNQEGSCRTEIRLLLLQPRCKTSEMCSEGIVGDSCVYSCIQHQRGLGTIYGDCVVEGETVAWRMSGVCVSIVLLKWCVGILCIGLLMLWIVLQRKKRRIMRRIKSEQKQLEGVITAV